MTAKTRRQKTKKARKQKMKDNLSSGFNNPMTGAGEMGVDKSQGGFFLPTMSMNRTQLETMYVESFAARKFVNIVIEDMFIRYRKFDDSTDEKVIDAIKEQEKKFKVHKRLEKALKSGRLYGTGLMCMISDESPLDAEFKIEMMKEGNLKNIIVVDRHGASVSERDKDHMSETFGEPLEYTITLKMGKQFKIHASRVLRFDGITPITSDGWSNYDQDWGVSELTPVMTSIMQDSQLIQGIAHLSTEASIPVQKIHDFQDALEASGDGDDMSLADRMAGVNAARSLYRTIFMDKEDEFQRQEVTFTGLPELIDRFAKRLAAAAEIPATRFWGQSPVGMNATGEADMVNYSTAVNAMQKNKLTDPVDHLDKILLRNAGIDADSVIEYTWLNLIDQSETDQSNIAKTKMETATMGLSANIIDEEEARSVIDGDPVIGNLKDIDDFEFVANEEEAANGTQPGTNTPKKEGRETVPQKGQKPANLAAV